jgi:hypothetical protein
MMMMNLMIHINLLLLVMEVIRNLYHLHLPGPLQLLPLRVLAHLGREPQNVHPHVTPPHAPQPGPSNEGKRKLGRDCRPPLQPGNVYGNRSDPVKDLMNEDLLDQIKAKGQQDRDPHKRDVNKLYPPETKVIGPQEEHFRCTFLYCQRRARQWRPQWNCGGAQQQVPIELASDKQPPNKPCQEHSPTSMDMEGIQRLVHEGGMEFLEFLMANTIAKPKMPVTYKDLADLPPNDRKVWMAACLEELQALNKHEVYMVMDLSKGCRAIKNQWVFNTKSDGWKRT